MSGRRAVIFDLDGTLVDSAPDIAAALNASLGAAGFATLPLSTVTTMVGGGARLLVERALSANAITGDARRVEMLHGQFLAHYHAHPCAHTRLYPYARETLMGLREAGFVLGIATNKPEGLTQKIVERLGLRSYFGSVIGSVPGLPLKPDPDMLFAVCRALGVKAPDALMVGDSAADAGAARAAGIPVVLLEHGYSTEPLTELGADAVLPGFEALETFLKQRQGAPNERALP